MTNKLLILFLAAAFFSSHLLAGSPVEPQVAEAIKTPGLTILHLWAPWCSNCQAELKSGGWTRTVKDNPEVRFYFVSVWNNGEDGRALLAKYGITQQPNVIILADPGARGGAHIKQFGAAVELDSDYLIFKGGDLRYAELRRNPFRCCNTIADSNSGREH